MSRIRKVSRAHRADHRFSSVQRLFDPLPGGADFRDRQTEIGRAFLHQPPFRADIFKIIPVFVRILRCPERIPFRMACQSAEDHGEAGRAAAAHAHESAAVRFIPPARIPLQKHRQSVCRHFRRDVDRQMLIRIFRVIGGKFRRFRIFGDECPDLFGNLGVFRQFFRIRRFRTGGERILFPFIGFRLLGGVFFFLFLCRVCSFRFPALFSCFFCRRRFRTGILSVFSRLLCRHFRRRVLRSFHPQNNKASDCSCRDQNDQKQEHAKPSFFSFPVIFIQS